MPSLCGQEHFTFYRVFVCEYIDNKNMVDQQFFCCCSQEIFACFSFFFFYLELIAAQPFPFDKDVFFFFILLISLFFVLACLKKLSLSLFRTGELCSMMPIGTCCPVRVCLVLITSKGNMF